MRDDGCGVGGGFNSGSGSGSESSDEKESKLREDDRRVLVRRGWTSKYNPNSHAKDGLGASLKSGHGDEFVATLGFRGEALASIAELSGSLCVTTRVESEDVGTKMVYGKNGEMVR